jgi:hypothetical protein
MYSQSSRNNNTAIVPNSHSQNDRFNSMANKFISNQHSKHAKKLTTQAPFATQQHGAPGPKKVSETTTSAMLKDQESQRIKYQIGGG